MSPNSPAISVQGLKKSYGDVHAVKGIDFEIQTGEVFGLLGPNGAGKTTTVEIFEGLRPRSGGQVAVLGFDPDKQRQSPKDRIGVLCSKASASTVRNCSSSTNRGYVIPSFFCIASSERPFVSG
jgi:ABC-2 type transport system ATP-binding protein